MFWRVLTAGAAAPIDTILTWLIQSTVLLALGLLAGRSLRRWGPAVQSASYRTTLVAILLCPIASIALAAMGFHGLLIRFPVAVESHETDVGIMDRGRDRLGPIAEREATALPIVPDRPPIEPTGEFTRAPDRAERTNDLSPTVEPPIDVTTAMSLPVSRSPANAELVGWASSILLMVWLVGAAALGARLVVGHCRMARLRSSAIAAGPDAEVLCQELARGMRLTPPAVLRSPFLSSPCLDGVRRPAILLPEDAKENLRETFVHELAHLAPGMGCGTSCGRVRPPSSGFSLCSGSCRSGWRKRPRRSATIAWWSLVPTADDMPGTCSSWPSDGCRRWPRRAWG